MLDTLDNVKDRLGITVDTYDDFLTQQITLISDTIEAYLRRSLTLKTYDQTFYRGDYKTATMLELFHFPLTAVASVTEDGEVVDTADYRIHKPTGRLVRTNGAFFWPEETVVRFTAGYSDETMPTPIIAVLDNLVQERYNKKTSGIDLNFGSDVQRISIPGAISIDFDYSLSNNDRKSAFGTILGSNTNVLDSYRSERTVLGDGKLEYIEEVP